MINIPYVMEFCADNIRGSVGTALSLSWPIAVVIAIFGLEVMDGKNNWRECLALIPVIPCSLALCLLICMPESPRWLFIAGRQEEGQILVDNIFESRPVVGWAYIGKAPTVVVEKDAGSEETIAEPYSELWSPSMRSITIVTSGLYICLASASNCIWTWGPTILSIAAGREIDLWVFQIAEVFSAVGIIVAILLLDAMGRMSLLCIAYFTCALICVFLALGGLVNNLFVPFAIMMYFVLSMSNGILWASVCTYMSEAFPTVLRSTGCGVAAFGGRIGSVVVPFAIGPLLRVNLLLGLGILAVLYLVGSAFTFKIPREMACQAMYDKYTPCDTHETALESGIKEK